MAARKFLIVDIDSDVRFFVSKTLLRHYPEARVEECADLNTAAALMRAIPAANHCTVVIAHRTAQSSGVALIAALRAAHLTVPIVWLTDPMDGGAGRSEGPTRMLDKNAWLMIGDEVRDFV